VLEYFRIEKGLDSDTIILDSTSPDKIKITDFINIKEG
jgi:hypothetical protein